MCSPGKLMSIAAYSNLLKCLNHYSAEYTFVPDVPWVVPSDILHCTTDNPILLRNSLCTEQGDDVREPQGLVGSAEQGFLHMYSLGKPLPTKAIAISPCFRNEYRTDTLHRPGFMKVELFHNVSGATNKQVSDVVRNMVIGAKAFFKSLCDTEQARHINVIDLSTKYGIRYDILYDAVELGSYGSRKLPTTTETYTPLDRYVYGTGIAEPRFSSALTIDSLTNAINANQEA